MAIKLAPFDTKLKLKRWAAALSCANNDHICLAYQDAFDLSATEGTEPLAVVYERLGNNKKAVQLRSVHGATAIRADNTRQSSLPVRVSVEHSTSTAQDSVVQCMQELRYTMLNVHPFRNQCGTAVLGFN